MIQTKSIYKTLEKAELIQLNKPFELFPSKNYQDFSQPNIIDKEKKSEKIKFLIKKRGRNYKNHSYINDGDINFKIKKEGRIHDKYCKDNIRRRIKSLYHFYIIRLLNNLMKKKFKTKKRKLVKMNIKITNNISIEYNRNLLEQKIKDIIINISNKYQDKDNNKNCIKYIEDHENNEELLNILNMTYKELYNNYYLKSTKNDMQDNSYEAHKEKLLALYGKEYLDKYNENAENFVNFFTNGKKRKNRKKLEVVEINIPLESESIETITNNKLLNYDYNNIDKNVQMISSSTQTDICDINSKIIAFI